MATLLLAEVAGGKLNGATARALTAALELKAPVDVLVAGSNVDAAAEAAAKLQGVAKVLVADDPRYEHGLAEPLAALIDTLAPGYDAIVAASTASAKNVAPRVAALIDVMQISDIIKVIGPKTFERPIYAGNAIQTVESAGTGCGQDHHLGRPGDAEGREFQDLYRAGRRQARRGDGRVPRRGRRRLRAQRLAGRPDRQGGGAGALYRGRHLGRDPASGGDEGFQGHRRDQQGRGGADLPGRRLRPGRRSLHGAARARRGASEDRALSSGHATIPAFDWTLVAARL